MGFEFQLGLYNFRYNYLAFVSSNLLLYRFLDNVYLTEPREIAHIKHLIGAQSVVTTMIIVPRKTKKYKT